ncbi:MAG: hypothetical protein GWN84_06560 [Gammaproteobacteria bacterium]|nr:hypothetical protein [Gammaproteobacteria bacterium]NIR82573.1 hypothetical protein [Gammaproteobacteria bacterium]NIR88776.1 hypothetical protein [Gammaproteobacteria bacterium]NIV73981.1 hypothetical protein [Gammaproteobacteria bacterium]
MLQRQECLERIAPASNRRAVADRRRRPNLFRDWRWLVGSRRRTLRRQEDQTGVCLDWYPPHLFVVAMGILVLNGVDATLTLRLLDMGIAREANPFMRALIEHDPAVFVNVKMLATGLCLFFLVAYSNLAVAGRFKIVRITYGILGCYLALAIYETVLLLTGAGA